MQAWVSVTLTAQTVSSSSWGVGGTAAGVADHILAPGSYFSVSSWLLHQDLRDGADMPLSSTTAAKFNNHILKL